MHTARGDDNRQDRPQRVHDQMPFASGNVLAGLIASLVTAFGRLPALAIYNDRTRLGVSLSL
ncbi:MAG: hypothetical protein NZM11_12940 [Anaerolineales bacterium]|nr:hypothetical protein [Anaerolineales bacterium]